MEAEKPADAQEAPQPAVAPQSPRQAEAVAPENVDLVQLIEQPDWKSILLDLVKSTKMDPWNIDLCELADKYLRKINSLKGTDLRLPANAILASAILLRFKARILKLTDIDDEFDRAEQAEREHQLIDNELPELTVIRKVREGKVTLDELVESMEKLLEQSKTKRSLQLGKDKDADGLEFRLPLIGAGFEEAMDDVYELVKKSADSSGLVLFSQLANGKDALGTVNLFIPILLLAHGGKVNVWQEEFFGEVFVSLVEEGKQKKAP